MGWGAVGLNEVGWSGAGWTRVGVQVLDLDLNIWLHTQQSFS